MNPIINHVINNGVHTKMRYDFIKRSANFSEPDR